MDSFTIGMLLGGIGCILGSVLAYFIIGKIKIDEKWYGVIRKGKLVITNNKHKNETAICSFDHYPTDTDIQFALLK